MIHLFKKLFHKHVWEDMEIRQVRVEDNRLVGFTTTTDEVNVCKICGKHKRMYISKPLYSIID